MIYLDHAATSYPKPIEVEESVKRCMTQSGGNPGRGSHAAALAASERVFECREALADLMEAPAPTRVAFGLNTTMAINTVLKGILQPGDHVLLSDLEHNAVLRPLNALARTRGISYDVYPTGAGSGPPSAERILYEIKKRIRKNTRMVLAIHASNVASVQLPIEAIGRFCRRRELFFVVDAAQSAGHVPISMKRACVDALCVPGHKGLLGPQGCGALLLSERISPESLLEGGSGVYSFDPEMPRELPERLEAGTLPTPAIAGLYAGICKLRALGMERIAVEERVLQQRLKKRLLAIPRMHVLAPYGIGSVLSFYVDGCPSETLGHALDQRGICVRAGFHCAPLAHQTLRSAQEGAVRVSIGYSNTVAEIDTLADALEEILKG